MGGREGQGGTGELQHPDKDLEYMEVDSTASTDTNIRDIFAATLCLLVVLGEKYYDVELEENVVDFRVSTISPLLVWRGHP